MAILVCGGAGYIGSHAVHALAAAGQEVVVVDNLQTGHAAAVAGKAAFVRGDIRDAACLDGIFRRFRIDGVMHFAADSQVGESMVNPLKYFNNNVGGMQSLLEAMVRHGVGRIVFSSSAAVYGEPDSVPVSEDAPTRPTNPYGHSKLMMEAMMRWVSAAHGIRYVSLRYFNVAGALADGSIGEDHSPESHLIPLVLQVPLGRRPHITIFGDDYATPDGTCIRDYIAVTDLVDAHVKALDHLQRGGDDLICNLGNGQGFSVRQIVDCARRVTGHAIPVVMGQRRAGDPARLVAAARKAQQVLGWQPRLGVEAIIESACAGTGNTRTATAGGSKPRRRCRGAVRAPLLGRRICRRGRQRQARLPEKGTMSPGEAYASLFCVRARACFSPEASLSSYW